MMKREARREHPAGFVRHCGPCAYSQPRVRPQKVSS